MNENICSNHIEIYELVEDLAPTGHAPKKGCSLIDVGFNPTVERLDKRYFLDMMQRGRSRQKFIVGPFGSGKTHLLRLIMERATQRDCVVSEISLNQTVDFTDPLIRYIEIVRELKVPGSNAFGMPALLEACIERKRERIADTSISDEAIGGWASTLQTQFKFSEYGKVLKQTIIALLSNDAVRAQDGIRWLSGEFNDKTVCRSLDVSPVTNNQIKAFATRAIFTLFQFIKYADFQGTLIGYDEAEQGLNVSRAKMTQIQTMLQSEINGLADLTNASAVIIFVVTPNIIENLADFPALQQRLEDPGRGFFDGADDAPQINLGDHPTLLDPPKHMKEIGYKITNSLFGTFNEPECPRCTFKYNADRESIKQAVGNIAQAVSNEGLGSGAKRIFIKNVCDFLLHVWHNDTVEGYTQSEDSSQNEPEF